ncbi:MAG: hypothetical protein IJ081_03465 [Prevotella sp.]|nr:hypothetical protein [Prevotella sp.]
MKTRTNTITGNRDVMVEGMMTFGKLETGQHTMEFMCCEDVVAEPFKGNFHVQVMRDGNVYISELKKRVRNKPLFRDDNASLSQGQDKRWYFCFSLDEDQLEQLPEKLVRQASAIAQKVIRGLICK